MDLTGKANKGHSSAKVLSGATDVPETRYIDGKWFCEDGSGGFLVYENEEWRPIKSESLKEKWITSETSGMQRCVVDGVIHEWNEAAKQWLPLVEVDEDFLAVYNANYGIDYNFDSSEGLSSSSEAAMSRNHEQPLFPKKAKVGSEDKKEKNQGWIELDESRISTVYVSNLPTSITEEAFAELMSKCGVIQRDPRTNKLKIKLYKDEGGNHKGDATCGYIKKESVDLALKILDGWDVDGRKIHVEKAKFQMKGVFDPAKKRKKLTAAQKKKIP